MYIPKRLLWNKPWAIRIFPLVQQVAPYTLLNYESLFQNYELLRDLDHRNIAGAVVECGAWKGGNGAFMAKVSGRETWLFDSFEGMPEREYLDAKPRHKRSLEKGDLAVSQEHAHAAAGTLDVQQRTRIIEGWFEDTLPKHTAAIGPIALLRIDGDFYASTKTVLEVLYDQVVPGGYVIFDDFHDFEGCRKAIYEFFLEKDTYPDIKDYYPMGKPFLKKEDGS